MHKIKEMLMKELYEYEDKAKKSSGKFSAGDLETIHKLIDTVSKIGTLKDDDGYSGDTDFMGEGRMFGTSYRSGGRNARRDSRNRYSSDGRYSRDGAKESLIEKLEEAMDEAENEQDREKIRKVIVQIENA